MLCASYHKHKWLLLTFQCPDDSGRCDIYTILFVYFTNVSRCVCVVGPLETELVLELMIVRRVVHEVYFEFIMFLLYPVFRPTFYPYPSDLRAPPRLSALLLSLLHCFLSNYALFILVSAAELSAVWSLVLFACVSILSPWCHCRHHSQSNSFLAGFFLPVVNADTTVQLPPLTCSSSYVALI